VVAMAPFACAGSHEEPPAPPAPPVDPATFSVPARTPAPEVDLRADLDGGNLWADADPTDGATAASAVTSAPGDAGTDARAPSGAKRKR
jgi:hypothetical protein